MSDTKVFSCFDPLDAHREFWNRRSKSPQSLDELLSYTHLVLGHLTSSTLLPNILRHGLTPADQIQRSVKDGFSFDSEAVYLRTSYDNFYPSRAVKRHGGKGAAIVVVIERSALQPDEAALSEIDRQIHSFETQLFLSLCFGACKHRGVVPPSKFLGVYDLNGNEFEYRTGARS